MSNTIKARILSKQQSKSISASIQAQRELKLKTESFIVRNVSDLTDIDTTNLENGSLLIFNTSTNKWTASRLLDNQTIEGGHF